MKVINTFSAWINRLKDRSALMTSTLTQDGFEKSSSLRTGAGKHQIRPLPLLGRLPVKEQYWISGGLLIVSLMIAGGLSLWVDKNKTYYNLHANSINTLKQSLTELQNNSYKVSVGLDALMPPTYLQMKRSEDSFVFMRSNIFNEYPELTGKPREELDKAWAEWVNLKKEMDTVAKGHMQFLTVRSKFANSKTLWKENVKKIYSLEEGSDKEVWNELNGMRTILNRVQTRLEMGEANISFGDSAKEMDNFLIQSEESLKKIDLSGMRNQESKQKIKEAINQLMDLNNSIRKINALLLNVEEIRKQTGDVSSGAGKILQTVEYVQLAIQDRLNFLSFLSYVSLGFGGLTLMSLALLAWINNIEGRKRTLEAKIENEANQKAIFALLDEISTLADGDLRVRVSVTEEITGAIADAVNFAITELSELVIAIKKGTTAMALATEEAKASSKHLLEISNKQSQEITATGGSVLKITDAIKLVSERMDDSKKVAQNSVESSEKGLRAVNTSIESIQSIKTNVEETGKRIKRLTEQSSQISEIVELIADISEKTAVLAINATVQATKAGAAGKGFKVVADDVQKLANQASGATRKIGALINAIQTDIQGAGMAMEKTTLEASKGADLAELTGEVLAEINDTSMALSQIVEEINEQIGSSADSAQKVSETMKRVLVSVSASTESSKVTSQAIEKIDELAGQLKESVEGFEV